MNQQPNMDQDDSDDRDENRRRTRNLSEKKRRDTFNLLVNELSSLISVDNRKMDKSTVLKSTILFLKNQNETIVRSRAHDVEENWKPTFLTNEEFTHLMLEALEGFVMVFAASGQIYYVSDSITSLLGYNPADVINKTIFDIVFEEDRPNLYNILQNAMRANYPTQPIERDNEINFKCHVRRSTLDFKDEATYELIHFRGHFRANIENLNVQEVSGYQDYSSRLLFVCTARLYIPQLIREVSLPDTNRNEFTSRHNLEWKFLFLDHRAPPIIGYLPFEVLGTSGYDYYHFDDLEKIVSCHEDLMQKGEITSGYYRFLTKSHQWIWLQSSLYISYHQWNSKPEFVVCTHRVVSYADVAKSTKLERDEAEMSIEAAADVEMRSTTSKDAMATLSPTYISETGDTYTGSYQPLHQPASVKSPSVESTNGTVTTTGTAATTAASWPCIVQPQYAGGSDTASVSGESRSSQRNSSYKTSEGSQAALVPQHGIGAQYLEPAPFAGTMSAPGVLSVPISSLPVIISSDQKQVQEQLQRRHKELQHSIVRHQEELRQVNEQLLVFELGILQTSIDVSNEYATGEGIEQNQRMPPQILYEPGQTRAIPGTNPQQQPPPPSGHYPHMPQ